MSPHPLQVRREVIDERNITEILCEEENLRKFRHENIIDFYGSCPRRKDPESALQILMIMELCESTLRFRIIGKEAVAPGKLAEQDGKSNFKQLMPVCYLPRQRSR